MLEAKVAIHSQIRTESRLTDADRLARFEIMLDVAEYSNKSLTELLILAQNLFGFLPENILLYIAKRLRIPSSRVWAVATFYDMFKFEIDIEDASSCVEVKDEQS